MVRSTIFNSKGVQAVHLPKQVAFPEGIHEVEIISVGQSRIVTPVGKRWDDFFARGPRALADFLCTRPADTVERRKPL